MKDPVPRRFLVVSADAQYARWLRHRIEATREDTQVELCALEDFDPASPGSSGIQLLILVLSFAAAADDTPSPGLVLLRAVSAAAQRLPMLVIAEDGNELSAIASLRNGATDYLPRGLVTPARLEAGIGYCLDRAVRAAAPQPAAPDADLLPLPRDLIPRYTLLSRIGESVHATVYLARSAALGQNIALKVSRVVDGEDAQFAQEYAAIGALDDPSIVQIHDYGIYDGREYIAMEYFPCGDLKARLQNPVSEAQAVAYLQRIAMALVVVHDAGIVHRDLKPPNIMLREDGSIVLIDFGLARPLDGTHITAAGVLRGSPYYMSPEQAQGGELDQRSDLYSLGVIFYEMLVGAKPYRGASAIEVLTQHVQSPVPELPEEMAGLQSLLDGLMAKQREARFPSARALLEQLGAVA